MKMREKYFRNKMSEFHERMPSIILKSIRNDIEKGKYGNAIYRFATLEWIFGSGEFFDSQERVISNYQYFEDDNFLNAVNESSMDKFFNEHDPDDDESDIPINKIAFRRILEKRKSKENSLGHSESENYLNELMKKLRS